MTQTYELCTRNSRQVLHHQLGTTEFKEKINLSPYCQFDSNYQRVWSNLMSADWAWTQAVWSVPLHRLYLTDHLQDEIAKNEMSHGAMFVPVVAGSDKTTVTSQFRPMPSRSVAVTLQVLNH
jgi:hypothetical protein